jgi:hypothetical protein
VQRRRVESLVLGALSSSPVHRALVLVLGTSIAVLLDCSKSSRQCSLPYLLLLGGCRIELAAASKMCCSGCGAVGEGAVAVTAAVAAALSPGSVKVGANELPAWRVRGDLVGGCCTQKGCPRNCGEDELGHAGLIACGRPRRCTEGFCEKHPVLPTSALADPIGQCEPLGRRS